MTQKKINAAIRHTGLEIQAGRGEGYAYFLNSGTHEQAGESVGVCFLSHLPLAEWVRLAEKAAGIKSSAAVSLGRLGGSSGRGAAKARTSEQARAAAQARWAKRKPESDMPNSRIIGTKK